MKRRPHLTATDIVKIQKRLEPLLKQDETGRWQYQNGFTDKKIADEFNIGEPALVRVRRELFGDLKLRGGFPGRSERYEEMAKRLADLEARVHTLEEFVAPTRRAAE